ncbi:MAG: extracellular solute-binding protein [Clostridiales bacterium]|nr:extracellular solute-binding protein [Clostridiales bacterium]
MKRRITALFLTTALMLSSFAGCSGSQSESTASKQSSSSTSAGSNEVSVWAWDANYNIPIIKKAGEYYAKSGHTGFKVNTTEMSEDDLEKKLITSFSAGTTEGLPDIVLLEDYDAQNFLQNYDGKFEDLTDSLDFSKFAQYKVTATSYNGKHYAIPFDSGVAGLYYRTDYLKQAGYTAKDMENLTWSKFIQIGKDVKKKTGKWFVVFVPYKGTHYIQMAMQSCGLWYFNDSGEIYLKNNPAVREMCDVLKQINKAQIAKPVDYFSAEGVGAITSGQAAAAMSAIWYLPTIESAKDQSGKWAYTNIPKLETVKNATQYSNLGGSSWFILSSSKNKEAAIDMMKTVFAGNNEFYQEILTQRGAVGTYLPSQSGSAYESEDKFFSNATIFKDFSSWMAKVPSVNYGVNTTVAYESLRSVLQDYFDNKLSLDDALTKAENYYKTQVGG